MTRQKKNRIRALLLLTVFSLNTVGGFACSIGVDMAYNTKHHEDSATRSDVKDISQAEDHSHAKGHSHDVEHKQSASSESISESMTEKSSSDDCCANDITNFIKLDKSVVNNNLLLQAPIFLLAFTSTFVLPAQNDADLTVNAGLVRRSWRPSNDTDLRIVIQSFQI